MDKTKSTMYEIPSCPMVFHVQESSERSLIKLLYGDMIIDYRGDFENPDSVLRNLLANRISSAYIMNEYILSDRVTIYFSTEDDYAAALLTLNP